MSISFQCAQCGKKLKAPDSAAGKSSKCPGCGGTVTCPVPDDDGEVVEMSLTPDKPSGFNPFSDLDDDKSYGVATAAPIEQSASGDDEIDPPLKRVGKTKSGKGKKKAELRSIAFYQRYLLICIFIQILTYIISFAMQRSMAAAVVCLIILLISGLASTVFAFMLTMKISNVGMAILVIVLSVIPCVGLIALLIVNSKATNRLRDNGIHVGFLGADLSSF